MKAFLQSIYNASLFQNGQRKRDLGRVDIYEEGVAVSIQTEAKMNDTKDLREDQWERIGGLLPGKAVDRGRTGEDNRRFVEGVLAANFQQKFMQPAMLTTTPYALLLQAGKRPMTRRPWPCWKA